MIGKLLLMDTYFSFIDVSGEPLQWEAMSSLYEQNNG